MLTQGRSPELLDAYAVALAELAGAFGQLITRAGAREENRDDVFRLIAEARAIATQLRDEGSAAPVDALVRDAITTPLAGLDEALSEMERAAALASDHGPAEFAPGVRKWAGVVVDAADIAVQALMFLGEPVRFNARLIGLTCRVAELRRDAVIELQGNGPASVGDDTGPLSLMVSSLKRATDLFADVVSLAERVGR